MALNIIPTATRHRKSLIVSLVVILVLRSRLLKLPQDVIKKIVKGKSSHQLSPEELAQALQQVYVYENDGSKTLLVPYRDGVSKVRFIRYICLQTRQAICIALRFDIASTEQQYILPDFSRTIPVLASKTLTKLLLCLHLSLECGCLTVFH